MTHLFQTDSRNTLLWYDAFLCEILKYINHSVYGLNDWRRWKIASVKFFNTSKNILSEIFYVKYLLQCTILTFECVTSYALILTLVCYLSFEQSGFCDLFISFSILFPPSSPASDWIVDCECGCKNIAGNCW